MMRRCFAVTSLVLSMTAAPAWAAEPTTPPTEPTATARAYRFGAAIQDAFLHRQGSVRYIFNDQNSTRITQSATAKRVELLWMPTRRVALNMAFQLPTRDETLRSGETVIDTYHFPKSLALGGQWQALRYDLTDRGWVEVAGGVGVEVALTGRPLDLTHPFAEWVTRFALSSGTALQTTFKYVGLVSEGHFAMVLGVAQRI